VTGEPPSYTVLVRRTHTKKDGTFGDYRAEELVTQAEMEATQVSNTNNDGSPQSPSATSAPSRILLNQAYLKVCFQTLVMCFVSSIELGSNKNISSVCC